MTWRYERWSAEHALPIGVSEHAALGRTVVAGEVIASGALLASARLVAGARRIGVAAEDLSRVLRTRVGAEVTRGAVLARTGRRFARAATAPIDGRVLHLTADGDFYLAPVVGRWTVRSTLDGTVVRSDEACVTVEGSAWSLAGIAAYGPDAVGELVLGVAAANDELAPRYIDTRLQGRIIVGGARTAAEAITRAHACGVAGLLAGAVPAGGLRAVYGDEVSARGSPSYADRPTVLCLIGFGAAPLPREVFEPFQVLAGVRAAIHTASARLFVFAPRDAGDFALAAPALLLAPDYGAVRPLSDEDAGAVNMLPYDAPR